MSHYSQKFIALDLETTHLEVEKGRIMEVGAVEVELALGKDGITANFGQSFQTLLNPEIEVPPTALHLTGITQAELNEAHKWREIKPNLEKFLRGQILVGHNIGFDLEFLKKEGLNLKNRYLDTLEIALTFLPLLPSHSLEFLAQEFKVNDQPSHRALSDAKSSARLLEGILNEYLSFSAELKIEIREYLKKSKLNFRDLFLELSTSSFPSSLSLQFGGQARKKKRGGESRKVKDKLELEIKQLLITWPDQTLLSLPLSFGNLQELILELSGCTPGGLVGLSNSIYLDVVPEEQKICPPAYALCEKRWSRLKNEQTLPDLAYKILIKIAIFRADSAFFDLSELKWNPDERLILPSFLVDPGVCAEHKCGYFESLALNKVNVYFLALESLFELIRLWPVDFSNFRLWLFDLSKIEDEFGNSETLSYNLRKLRRELAKIYPIETENVSWLPSVPKEVENIANELDLFFGILHLVYLKKEEYFSENILLDEKETQNERFLKLFHPAEKLIEKLQNFAEYLQKQVRFTEGELSIELAVLKRKIGNFIKFFQEFFFKRSSQNVYWLRFNAKWVDLNISPIDLAPQWQKISGVFQSVTLVDTEISELALKYFQERLGLQSFSVQRLPVLQKQNKVTVKVASQSLSQSNLVSFLTSLPGRSLLLIPSEAKLAEIYELLQEKKTAVTQHLVYKFGGNLQALKKKYRGSENVSMVLTTNIFLREFLSLPPTDNLILVRLPFEAPGTRIAMQKATGQDEFADRILPRAVHLLHLIISRFVTSGSSRQTIYLLDSRIVTDYEQAFLKYLETLPNFEISTIEEG